MRTGITVLTLAVGVTLSPLAQPPRPTQPAHQPFAAPQQTQVQADEAVVQSTCWLMAFAYGHQQISPQHQQLIRQDMNQTWRSGNTQAINLCRQLPMACQQIVAQPQQVEQSRQFWRQFFEQVAASQPTGPIAQVVRDLSAASPPPVQAQPSPYASSAPGQVNTAPQSPQQQGTYDPIMQGMILQQHQQSMDNYNFWQEYNQQVDQQHYELQQQYLQQDQQLYEQQQQWIQEDQQYYDQQMESYSYDTY